MKQHAHKIGAVLYALWGILHVLSGIGFLYGISKAGAAGAIGLLGNPDNVIPQNFTGVALGLLTQHSWNLVIAGLFAFAIAVTMNWRNSRLGYWLNLYVIGAFDLAFIFAVVLPGYTSVMTGWLGPALWVLGAVFSTIGLYSGARTTAYAV